MFLFEPIEAAPAGLRWTVCAVCVMVGLLRAALTNRERTK